MSLRSRRLLLSLTGVMCASLFIFVIAKPVILRDPTPPDAVEEKLTWLARHPSDWLTATAIADGTLELRSPRRFELWRAAYAHAHRLAPHRRNADAALVRSGLFHWAELGAEDRAVVLRVAAPLMREPQFFARMSGPLLQLTRDFSWIRRNAPDTLEARLSLRDLSVERGLFDDYRILRHEVRIARLGAMRRAGPSADPNALLELLPEHLEVADEPLVRTVLEALDRQSFAPETLSSRIENVVRFAVRHDISPLKGIAPLVETPGKLKDATRARAALALGRPELATQIEITSAVPADADWQQYFIDRALFAARAHDARTADAYLVRVAAQEMGVTALSAALDAATILGNAASADAYRRQLRAMGMQPRKWNGTCGPDELCNVATADVYTTDGVIRIAAEPTQSDETPPYVEIDVDDARLAEGKVPSRTTFEMRAQAGAHRVEVRLVNGRTRAGVQRRLRLS